MRFTVVVRKSESLPSIYFIEYCTIFFTELLNVKAKMITFIADIIFKFLVITETTQCGINRLCHVML